MFQNKVIINDIEIPYVINYKKIKNIYFRVKEDHKIYVTCNHLVSEKYIEKLLIKNSDSIYKMYLKMNNKNSDEIYYLGNKLTYEESINISLDNNYIYAPSRLIAQKYIYSKSYEVFLTRVNQLKIMFHDLPEFRLKVRHMTSKWGVCNKNSMTITLNDELIKKDINLIDYVIIHELCHFRYMNHSREYWQYVSKYYPYYKQARKELNY